MKDYEKNKKRYKTNIYIPPYKLKQQQKSLDLQQDEQNQDIQIQKQQWIIMCKQIKGIINRACQENIQFIIKDLLNYNLLKGKGILVNTLLKSQEVQPKNTGIFACISNIINCKIPQIGQLLITRLILQFRNNYKDNNRLGCRTTIKFIAHLINQKMLNEMFGIQILIFLLENFTEDSLELACYFLNEIGQILIQLLPEGIEAVYESLKEILGQKNLTLKCQFLIEQAFENRRENFKQYPSIPEELDIVDDNEIIIHNFDLDEEDLDPQNNINQFKYDQNYDQNEQKWLTIKQNILGEDNFENLQQNINKDQEQEDQIQNNALVQRDMTNQDLKDFRVQVYMRIMNSVSYEEAAHKLLQLQMKTGLIRELCEMTIDCCLEQKSYTDFFGQLCVSLSEVNQEIKKNFFLIFADRYFQIFDYDVQKIRKLSYLFSFMFYNNAIDWEVFSCIELDEEQTTASQRIFIKFLFQKMAELMGIEELNERLRCPEMREYTQGIFYCENQQKLNFVVDFFTYCGLNGLVLDLKSELKQIKVQKKKKINKIKKQLVQISIQQYNL